MKFILSLLSQSKIFSSLMASWKSGVKGPVIGLGIAVMFVLWLIPTVVNGFFSLVWFIVRLPFRLVWWLVADGIFGLLAWLWAAVSAFFDIFGILGVCVKWVLAAACVAFAALFVFNMVAGAGASADRAPERERGGDAGKPSGPERKRPRYDRPPRIGARSWALNVLGLTRAASEKDIRARYRELVKEFHPDRLGPDASDDEREDAAAHVEQINKAYEILTR